MASVGAGSPPTPGRFPWTAWIAAAAVAVVILLLGWLTLVRLTVQARAELVREQEIALNEQKLILRGQLSEVATSVATLGQMAVSQTESPDSASIRVDDSLRAAFLNYARTRQSFDHLLLFAPSGAELLDIKRIRSRNGTYYFRDTTSEKAAFVQEQPWASELLALPAARVRTWAPHLKLAADGSVEDPPVPLLRIGAALQADRKPQPVGYIVVDVLADTLFRDIERADSRLGIRTQITNAEGYWMHSDNPSREWGYILPDRHGESLAASHPKIWREISSRVGGTIDSADGVVVFDALNLAGADFPVGVPGLDQAWRILTWVPAAEIAAIESEVAKAVWGWTALGLALFVPLTWMIAMDRRKQRATTRAREQTHALLKSIADSTIDGILAGEAVRDAAGDICDFRLVFSNPAAAHILRTFAPNAGADGREFPLFFMPEFFSRCVQVASTGVRYETEQSADSESLGRRWFRLVVVPLGDGIVMTISDITQQKFAVHELRRAKEAAEVANRAKSQFLTMMGHEIRTPMNGLLGFASLLESTELSDEQRDCVSTLKLSGEALLRILEDILDYSHMEFDTLNLKSVPVDVREVVKQVSRLFTVALSGRNLKLVTRVAPSVPAVFLGDDVRLRQILLNLIGNAVKFTNEGFIVLDVSVDAARKEEFLVFHVTDSGTGVPPEMVDRLFEPFSQVDSSISRRFGGTGLGLSICKRLVESMGGEIGVNTATERGADFYFSLPIVLPEFASREDVVPVPGRLALSEQPPRILVVDDDPINRKLILRMIEKLGAQVELAASGDDAITAFQGSHFDLILMDVQMPGMDGLETTRRIRTIEREGTPALRTPISAVTANAAAGDREQCLAAGMDDYLCKPVRLEALEKLIERNLPG